MEELCWVLNYMFSLLGLFTAIRYGINRIPLIKNTVQEENIVRHPEYIKRD